MGFAFGVDAFLEEHLKHSQRHTFQYQITHIGEYHLVYAPGLDSSDIPGVSHSDESYLEWEPLYNWSHPLNESDAAVSRYITTMWSNFIKQGDPTPVGSGLQVHWDPQTTENRRYLVIDNKLEMMDFSQN